MWRVILTAWSAVNSGLCAAALQDGPGCAEGHDAGDAENSGGSSLAAGKAWSLQLQRSSQSNAVAEKAEVLLGEQSEISKGIRKAMPALRSLLTQCWCLPCPRVENRLENTQRRQEDNQGPRTAELTMETQGTPVI